MVSGFATYHCQFTPQAMVPIGAAARKQAGILYRQAAGFIQRTPALRKRFKVQDGYQRITCLATGSLIEVYAASDDTGDGIIPTLPIIDEYHRHKGHNLQATWEDKLDKRDGQMLIITTAGDVESNQAEQLRDEARKLPILVTEGRHTRAASEDLTFCMHELALRRDDDPHDMQVVKMVNPAPWVTIEKLQRRHDSPSMRLWHWLRFTCNVRARGEGSAIQPEELDPLELRGLELEQLDEIRKLPHWVGLDIAWKRDHVGISPLGWESAERRFIHDVVTIAPPIDENDIVKHLLLLQLLLPDLRGVVYDPNAGGQQMAQLLEKGKHPLQTDEDARLEAGLPPLAEAPAEPLVFIEHSQDNAPMALAASRFEEGLRNAWFRWTGRSCSTPGCECGGWRGHVLNAVEKGLTGEKKRYDRPSDAQGEKRTKYPIDAFSGTLFANSIAVAEMGSPDEPLDRSLYRFDFGD